MFCPRFSFQLRLKDKNGVVLVPKKNTIAAYTSVIQMEVDISDCMHCCVFSEHDELWCSVDTMLVSEGRRSDTKHHYEVDVTTMRNIYNLLSLMKSRGTH